MSTGILPNHKRQYFTIRVNSSDVKSVSSPGLSSVKWRVPIIPAIHLNGGSSNWFVAMKRISLDDSLEDSTKSVLINTSIVKPVSNGSSKASVIYRIPADHRTQGFTTHGPIAPLEYNPVNSDYINFIEVEITDTAGNILTPGTSQGGTAIPTTMEMLITTTPI